MNSGLVIVLNMETEREASGVKKFTEVAVESSSASVDRAPFL